MRLLIFTQKVDKDDTVLGFFHGWIKKIAEECDSVEVICLEKGEYSLPKNVTVYSLGKERKVSKSGYVINLYKYLYLIRGSYDRVLVHMNQEYILLAGFYWRVKGIPVYLWRNHPYGDIFTRVAVFLSNKIFCTSTKSFTARFRKTVIMPAGIDTENFKPVLGAVRKKYSVCMVGRISPVKHLELSLEAVKVLTLSGTQASLAIVGPVLDRDKKYFDSLKKYVAEEKLSGVVSFLGAKSIEELPEVYSSYEICLNLTDSGSFDKTVVEASACGAVPLVANTSFNGLLPDICITPNDSGSIASSIKKLLDPSEKVKIQKELLGFVETQSLSSLIKKLQSEMK